MEYENKYEYTKHLVRKLSKAMSQKIIDEVPDSGKFEGKAIIFKIADTDNIGGFQYENMLTGPPTERKLTLVCSRIGTSYVRSTLIFHGTNAETIEFLKFSDEQVEEYMKIFFDFSEKVDEFWEDRQQLFINVPVSYFKQSGDAYNRMDSSRVSNFMKRIK